MKGLIYKNFIQNRIFIILSAVAPSVIVILILFTPVLSDDGDFSVKSSLNSLENGGIIIRLFFMIVGYAISGAMHPLIISCDEVKKWGYFTATAPQGVKGQVYSKYVTIFMMCGMTFICSYCIDIIIASVVNAVTGIETELVTGILIYLFYFQIFIDSIDIPFMIRFGAKKGADIKALAVLAVIFAVIVYLLFGPLPENMDSFMESVYKFIEDFNNGEMPDWLLITAGFFPVIAVVCYCVSCRISYGLYLKGVETYDK